MLEIGLSTSFTPNEENFKAVSKAGIKNAEICVPFYEYPALNHDKIKKGANIGIDKFVIHPCGEPKSRDDATREEEIKRSMQSLDFLAECAARESAVIAV